MEPYKCCDPFGVVAAVAVVVIFEQEFLDRVISASGDWLEVVALKLKVECGIIDDFGDIILGVLPFRFVITIVPTSTIFDPPLIRYYYKAK